MQWILGFEPQPDIMSDQGRPPLESGTRVI